MHEPVFMHLQTRLTRLVAQKSSRRHLELWHHRRMRVALIVSSIVVLALSACTSDLVQSASPFGEKKARCDLRPGTPQCTDVRKFAGPSLATFEGVCGSLKQSKQNATGYEEDQTCPVTDMWGGCQSTSGDGSQQTNWYYKSDKYKTEADARAECDSNQSFVAPQ